MSDLTQKQEAFCLSYVETGNASEAYRAAYDTSNMKPETVNRKAKEMMDNGKIAARIEELRGPALEKANVTVEWIVENLVEVVERCMQRRPVMVRQGRKMAQMQDEEGRHVWAFDSKGVNSALQTLARYKGMLVDKKEHSGLDGAPLQILIEYGSLDDSEESEG